MSKALLVFCSVAGTISLLAAVAGAAPPSGNGDIVISSNGRLYAVDPDDRSEADLGPGVMPAWSPDGSRLAFWSDGGTSVMNADGSGRRLLHRGDDRQSVWSPDGTKLAFVTQSLPGNGALVVTDVASGDSAVAVGAGVRLEWPPSWSPDGAELAYTEGSMIVVAVGRDGSGRRLIAAGPGFNAAPAWSPDGSQIAFLHGDGGSAAVHVVAAAGGLSRPLTQTPTVFTSQPGSAPSWSPDGTQISFTGTQVLGWTKVGPIYASAVHVVDAEGTLERRLTRGSDVPGYWAAGWSPDGRRILFRTGGAIFFMNPDGSCETRLGERVGDSPTWRPISAPAAPYLRCADLDVGVIHDRSAVAAGGAETFEVTVRNLENEPATGVSLRSAAPQAGSFESVTTDRGSCSLDGGSLSCELGGLAVGERAVVTVSVRAAGVGVVSANAEASANEPDGNRGNNVATLRVEALPCGLVARDRGDRLIGTSRADRICGRAGQDQIWGLAGDDFIDAGPQADRVFPGPGMDVVRLRAGADFADSRDGQPDVIDCGGERDLVLVDRFDEATKDCEHVERPRIHRCKKIGTVRSDELVGTGRSDEVCALSGNDEIHTLAGNDAVDAGSGNDTVDGGRGRDVLLAGEGYDTIFARDGARDRIRCGPQNDLVYADRIDMVAHDCERVQRR